MNRSAYRDDAHRQFFRKVGAAYGEIAVDEVIEIVLEKGGKVVFTDLGTLSMHQQIALILRY